jgi:hypothetical protein
VGLAGAVLSIAVIAWALELRRTQQAQELVDLLPQVDVDDTLLAEESFREMLAASTSAPPSNRLGTNSGCGRRSLQNSCA